MEFLSSAVSLILGEKRKVNEKMKVKMMIGLAAVAVATVAGASTNYVEMVAKNRNPVAVVRAMSGDSELAEPAAFRAALEAVDAAGKADWALQAVSRRCPLTAKAVLGRCGHLTAKARADVLAKCGYDAANKSVELTPGEAGYANYALLSASAGAVSPAAARNGILNSSVLPVRRWIRAGGGSFVGADGAKKVKAKLDELAKELNAPRFGKAGAILKEIGIEVEWEAVQARIPGDTEVAEIRTKLLDGETAFSQGLQYRLCAAMGVGGYNALVKEYNGK